MNHVVCRFVVKETREGRLYVFAEARDIVSSRVHLLFWLEDGASIETAEALARTMQSAKIAASDAHV